MDENCINYLVLLRLKDRDLSTLSLAETVSLYETTYAETKKYLDNKDATSDDDWMY